MPALLGCLRGSRWEALGTLRYGEHTAIEFTDRELTHLQAVIGAKFRRGESFHFSWEPRGLRRETLVTMWMHPNVPVSYLFEGWRTIELNRVWIDQLMNSANTPAGLVLTPEPDPTRS